MTTRGVDKLGVAMVERTMAGIFDSDPVMERRLMDLIVAYLRSFSSQVIVVAIIMPKL